MYKVGLTGGIGCGKTTVSNLFLSLNIPVIDADKISHRLVEPGQALLADVTATFSNKVLNPDGSLNRTALRDIVFSDPIQRNKLEAIMHPAIFKEMQRIVDAQVTPYCIVSIPLLFETDATAFVHRILLVDCPEELQIQRVKERDGLSEDSIRLIMRSQVDRKFRLTHADDIIHNDGNSDKLAEQVKKLHNFYLSMCTTTGQSFQ
jgi:dephospho-CoA kinase